MEKIMFWCFSYVLQLIYLQHYIFWLFNGKTSNLTNVIAVLSHMLCYILYKYQSFNRNSWSDDTISYKTKKWESNEVIVLNVIAFNGWTINSLLCNILVHRQYVLHTYHRTKLQSLLKVFPLSNTNMENPKLLHLCM